MYDIDFCAEDDRGEGLFYHPRNVAFRRHHRAEILRRIAPLDVLAGTFIVRPQAMPELSYASVNLKMLGQLLNFTQIERTWLLWAYCERDCGLPKVPVKDHGQAYRMLAKLWAVPIEQVLVAASPNRLRALELLNGVRKNGDGRRMPVAIVLADFLSMTKGAADLLSRPHRSHAALLNAMLEPQSDGISLRRLRETLFQWLPRLVAEAYLMEFHGQSPSARHLAALLRWHCNMAMPVNRFAELAGHIDTMAVRQAIKHAVFSCCQLQRPVTPFLLLKSIYDAAT